MARKHSTLAAMQPVRVEATSLALSALIGLHVIAWNSPGCAPPLGRRPHSQGLEAIWIHAGTPAVGTPLIQRPRQPARTSEKISWSLVPSWMDSWTECQARSPWAPRDPVRFMLIAMGKPRVRFQPHAGQHQL
ncbi:hypothetical protein BDV11DRAFT_112254 [Aspergillus similis]